MYMYHERKTNYCDARSLKTYLCSNSGHFEHIQNIVPSNNNRVKSGVKHELFLIIYLQACQNKLAITQAAQTDNTKLAKLRPL